MLGLALLLLPALGCDKATPVAPAGVVLTISASPSQVALNGSSTITVVGRKPDGQPLNPGTEIRFSTNLGTVNPLFAIVGSGGVATTVFTGDGRSGVASITASTGTSGGGGGGSAGGGAGGSGGSTPPPSGPQSGVQSVSINIRVGEDPDNRPTLLVSANPSSIPVGTNSTSTITIIGRNRDLSPVSAGQTVLLTSTLGTLNPQRPTTRADGTATSTLTAGLTGGSAEIGAILGTSDRATTTVTIRDAAVAIGLRAEPRTIPSSGGTITLIANVTNGQGVGVAGAQVRFESDRGTFADGSSVFTDSNGEAQVELTVTQAQLDGLPSGGTFQVRAKTNSGTGSTLEASDTVTKQ